ncbi:DUF305 domain-containing protein [Helicobacter cholecystus]|uniref:DUF305 domain-containing protein n=1 Tax=Helicobacter cholecystus TaxID=45498 RepID=UPI0027395C5F|nr:DUF305 domain-containing protein [Helicobacter cholecystus]
MRLRTLALSVLLTSLTFASTHSQHTHHNEEHTQNKLCDISMIKQSANTPSQKVNALMHAPMMCNPWVESKNIEIDYLSNMIPHHQGAILSSEEFLKYTKNPELIKIAQEIIQTQKKEIKDFHHLLETIDKKESPNYKIFTQEAKEDMHKMMKAMRIENDSKDVEIDYMQSMIAHHQGAIDASKQVLKYTKNQEIIKVANEIISAQEKEIKQFQQLLKNKRG